MLEQAAIHFVEKELGRRFVESANCSLEGLTSLYNDSSPFIPIILILSPAADPTVDLLRYAASMHYPQCVASRVVYRATEVPGLRYDMLWCAQTTASRARRSKTALWKPGSVSDTSQRHPNSSTTDSSAFHSTAR